jgi:hypothetical protein
MNFFNKIALEVGFSVKTLGYSQPGSVCTFKKNIHVMDDNNNRDIISP